MMRRTLQRVVVAMAATFLFAMAAAARQPGLHEDLASGKYALAGGGYAVVAVDDFGRLEGYYERDGEFGRLSGLFLDGAASGYWVTRKGRVVCHERREGSSSWGRFRLNWDDAGKLRVSWSACEAEPVE